METIASVCAYCGCGCRLLFIVEDGRIVKMLPERALIMSHHRNRYQFRHELILSGDVLSSKHRMIKKNFETEMRVNNVKLPLNHFI